MAKIGIALSGGGHRASLFGLGVLLYLVDAGKNRDVNSIASVSGGSLTNGCVAQWKKFRGCNAAEFDEGMRPLVRRLATNGTLWGWRWIWLYLLFTLISGITTFGTWFLTCPILIRLGLFLIGIVISAELFRQRGRLCGCAFAATLFSPSGRPTLLRDTANAEIDYVICATDLHAGEHVYFSGNFVCSYRFGWGEVGDLPLHVAVQASAAFPGGFPARWLRTERDQFSKGVQVDASWMVLSDGGVYDNMGEQWSTGVARRKVNYTPLANDLHEPEELIVVNSSANLPWTDLSNLRIPLVGELLTMLRVILVLHDNTTTARRQWLFERFKRSLSDGQGLRGTIITIEQTPHRVAEDIRRLGRDGAVPAEVAERAEDVLQKTDLGTEEEWRKLAERNSRVSTTFRSLGESVACDLIRHAYVVAMCNLHVILTYPLLAVPTQEQVRERLISNKP
jgi:predicted acylesterase/phospholipase RssA